MVYEVVVQSIDPARRDEYIANYKDAWRALALEGCRGGELLRSIEKPDRVIIVLEWDSVEAHRQHRGPKMNQFLQQSVRPYQTAVSDFDHYIVEEI
jgi:quinol monooxygenase YgiN